MSNNSAAIAMDSLLQAEDVGEGGSECAAHGLATELLHLPPVAICHLQLAPLAK